MKLLILTPGRLRVVRPQHIELLRGKRSLLRFVAPQPKNVVSRETGGERLFNILVAGKNEEDAHAAAGQLPAGRNPGIGSLPIGAEGDVDHLPDLCAARMASITRS